MINGRLGIYIYSILRIIILCNAYEDSVYTSSYILIHYFNVKLVSTYVNHILRPSCTCCSLRINLAICKTNCRVVSFER